MLRKVIIVFAAILVGVQVYGQQKQKEKKQYWYVGLEGGFSFSFFNSPVGEYGHNKSLGYVDHHRTGVLFKGKLFYQINESFRLETGIGYAGKGGAYRREIADIIIIDHETNDQAYEKKRFRLDYLEVPFVLGCNLKELFKIGAFKGSGIYLNTGFLLGFAVNSDIKSNYYKLQSENIGGLVEADERFRTEPFDVEKSVLPSLLLGVTFVQFEQKAYQYSISLSYQQSLGGVYKNNTFDQGSFGYQTNMSSFGLGVGVEFK